MSKAVSSGVKFAFREIPLASGYAREKNVAWTMGETLPFWMQGWGLRAEKRLAEPPSTALTHEGPRSRLSGERGSGPLGQEPTACPALTQVPLDRGIHGAHRQVPPLGCWSNPAREQAQSRQGRARTRRREPPLCLASPPLQPALPTAARGPGTKPGMSLPSSALCTAVAGNRPGP